MKKKIKLFVLIVINVGLLIFPFRKEVLAWIPGGLEGYVYYQLPDNTKGALPGVKLYRRSCWVPSKWGSYGCGTPDESCYNTWYNQSGCWSNAVGVEVTSQSNGYFHMWNGIAVPTGGACNSSWACQGGVENCLTSCWHCNPGGAANKCLSGPMGSVTNSGCNNWCGYNCGMNPHQTIPYFPSGFKLPGNLESLGYSHLNGNWCQGVPYEGDWGNNENKTHNYTYCFNALPTLTPTITPTSPPPTATPTATPTPIPTATPTVTNTPTPTFTPTPTLPPACYCESMTYTGVIAPGNTVTFVTYARGLSNTKVLHMIYHVEINGSEVTKSSPIAATEITPTPPSSANYVTRWSYTIPSNLSGVVYYRIWVEIVCAYKTAGLNTADTKTVILGATSEKRAGFFELLIRAITSFFGGQVSPTPKAGPTPAQTEESVSQLSISTTPIPTDTPIPEKRQTLKLKTFVPISPTPIIQKGCKEIKFWITYVDY